MGLPLKNIVIVDDERGIQDLLRQVLADEGYTIVGIGADGAQAVDLVRAKKPDLILLDVHMPGVDGIEAARQIVALQSTAVVILSADQNTVVARSLMDIGVCAYMKKPLDVSQLVPILESAWHRFQTQKALEEEKRALQDTLETRKVLEKAKGILMEQQGYTEEEAHRTLQKMSQEQGVSIKELCRSLIQVRMVLGSKSKASAPRKAA